MDGLSEPADSIARRRSGGDDEDGERLRKRCEALELAVEFQNRKLELQHKKLISVIETNAVLLTDQPIDDVLGGILESALSILGAGGGSLMLRDSETNTLSILASKGIGEEVDQTLHPRVGEGIAGWVAQTGETLLLSGDIEDPRFRLLCVRELKDALCAPLIANGTSLGVLNVRNSTRCGTFDESDLELLRAFADQAAIAIEVARRKEEIDRLYLGSVAALAEAVDARDTYTAGHSASVREWAVRLAEKAGLEEDKIRELSNGALLHDIGKIGIADGILRKGGVLTEEEYAVVKEHPILAVRILGSLGSRHDIIPMILHHHEHYDGSGYPAGLSGEEIPMEARILAVADAFHAMASARPYRDALPRESIIEQLIGGKGTQFDPKLVDLFLECLDEAGGAEQVLSPGAARATSDLTGTEGGPTSGGVCGSSASVLKAVQSLSAALLGGLTHFVGFATSQRLERTLNERASRADLGYRVRNSMVFVCAGREPNATELLDNYLRFFELQESVIIEAVGNRLYGRLLGDSLAAASRFTDSAFEELVLERSVQTRRSARRA